MMDIHSHLLFGVDDVSKTLEETMSLVDKAVGEWLTDIFVTPHAFSSHYHVLRAKTESQIGLVEDVIHATGHCIQAKKYVCARNSSKNGGITNC